MALVVKTNVAAFAKNAGKRKGYTVNSISEDFLPAIEAKVRKLLEDAVDRAHSNGRRTVMGKDA
ncbi:TPA: DUF1931 domain-containing protein [Candidatus Woesearchaeota archaeon]|nr:DUF1931 domain-containing protein [Candidatus Woesearchaeota archaeon]